MCKLSDRAKLGSSQKQTLDSGHLLATGGGQEGFFSLYTFFKSWRRCLFSPSCRTVVPALLTKVAWHQGPSDDWRGASLSSNPTGVLPVSNGHMVVVRLWERRRVGVGPPAARTVHTAHSVPLPTSEELSGRRARRRELRTRCIALVGRLQPAGHQEGTPAPTLPAVAL